MNNRKPVDHLLNRFTQFCLKIPAVEITAGEGDAVAADINTVREPHHVVPRKFGGPMLLGHRLTLRQIELIAGVGNLAISVGQAPLTRPVNSVLAVP